MPTTDEMSVSDRRTYLKQMKKRYVTAKRVERGGLLTEMEQVTGLHRKSLYATGNPCGICGRLS